MPKAYSGEMRERVIAEVESGASRREAAEEFAVSQLRPSRTVPDSPRSTRCSA
jgi:transposase-like protein